MMKTLPSLALLHLVGITSALPTSGESNGIPCRAEKSFDSEPAKTYPTIHDINIHFTDLARNSEFDGWIRTADSCYISVRSLPSPIEPVPGDSAIQSRQFWNPGRWLAGLAEWLPGFVTGGLSRVTRVSDERAGHLSQRVDDMTDDIITFENRNPEPGSPFARFIQDLELELECVGWYEELYRLYRVNLTNQVTVFLEGQTTDPVTLRNQFESLKDEFADENQIRNFDDFFHRYVDPLAQDCKNSDVFKEELQKLMNPN